MSDKEEKNSKQEEPSRINQDGISINPETLSEGNVLSSGFNKNAENNSVVIENMPHSAKEGSGDNKEISELDLIEAELTEMSKELDMDAGKGIGDTTTKVKVGKHTKIMDILTEMDANTSKTDAIVEKDGRDLLDKCDDIEPKMADILEEIDDEDIELRWDDDDASDQPASDKKNDNLSEGQLLKDSSDVLTKDTNPKTVTVKDNNIIIDDNSKEIASPQLSGTSLKLDIHSENTEDEKTLEDLLLEEPDVDPERINSPEMIFSPEIATPQESGTSSKLNIHSEKTEDEKTLEDVLFEEPDVDPEDINSPEMRFSPEIATPQESGTSSKLNIHSENTVDEKTLEDVLFEEPDVDPEDINSPEMIFSPEESMDRDFIKVLEDKLLEDSVMNSKMEVIAQAKEILEEKCVDKVTKETEAATSDLSKEDAMDTQTKNHFGIIKEAELEESKSKTKTETATLQVPSFTDIILNEDNADDVLEENLIEKPDSKCKNSANVSEKDTESDIPEKELKEKELDDDVLLEEKLLEETEAPKVIPESDVTMEVDDEKEGELLKDDEVQDDSHTPMDVTDAATEDQAKVEDKLIDQPMSEQPAEEKEDIANQKDDQTNPEKVDIDQPMDEVKEMDEPDKAILMTEKMIDQPVEGTSKTVDVIPTQEQSESVEINKETAIEDPPKADEENIDLDVLEKQNENQSMTDGKKIEDQITVETDTAEPSIKNPQQTVPLTIPNPPSVEIEEPDKSITEKNTLDEVIIIKEPGTPEITTENVHEDTVRLVKTKISINFEEDTGLDTNNVKMKGSLTTTIFREKRVSPIKGMHGLNKPDMMLEIPSQELIDMDCSDLSLNLDQSEITDSLNDSLIANIKTEDEIVTDESIETLKGDDNTVTDKSVDTTKADNDTAIQNTVDQVAVVTETKAVEIATEDDTVTEKSVDPTKADDDTASQNTVEQVAVVTETKATEFDTVNDKSVDQQTAVTESTVDEETVNKAVESAKTVVEATIEEFMERMFADEEPEVPKEVPECIASTSQSDLPVEQPQTSTNQSDLPVDQPQISTSQSNLPVEQPQISTSQSDLPVDQPQISISQSNLPVEQPQISTSQSDLPVEQPQTSTSQSNLPVEQPQTSTTQMAPDTSDELPEVVSDSLGLLAESAGRVMDDDEVEDDDDGDDDDDYESSNQVSAEQSEDSNPAALESEPVTEAEDKELETPEPKEGEFAFNGEKIDDEDFGMEVDVEPVTIQGMNDEARSAVAALLNADNLNNEPEEDPKEATDDQTDIETVKLSDISDNEMDIEQHELEEPEAEASKDGEDKQKQSPSKSPAHVSPKQSPSKQSPSKMKNLAITTQAASKVVNIVDLGESSSEDDVQETEVQKQPQPEPETTDNSKPASDPDSEVTTVNIPTGIDIMCTSGGNTSEITTKEGEVTISGVPKPPPHKPARLNTSEVSIKTVSSAEPMVIPETKINEQTNASTKPKLSLEIFNLDSDEDDSSAKEKSTETPPNKLTALELEKARETSKCVNSSCTSDNTVPYRVAETSEILYYDASRKKHALICKPCADVIASRLKNLTQGIKDMTPLLDMDMARISQDLVEISDSESEEDYNSSDDPKETIGEGGAEIIDGSLAKCFNSTWRKYNMDARLKEAAIMLDDEIERLEQESKEINAMLNECQAATDKLRNDLYATFEGRKESVPSLIIVDTPENKFIGPEEPSLLPPAESIATRRAKRRASTTNELPAKRPAIPLGYAPLDSADAKEKAAIPAPDVQMDDDKDISVVKLSAEAAPADLPPPGEISRPPLRVGMPVYAMKNAFGPWFKSRVIEIQPKNPSTGIQYSHCRVRFDHKCRNNSKVLKACSVAYSEPADVRMTIGTRVIALIKDSNKKETYYAGVVAEIPNPVNSYRYLVFFDDGYAQYVQHRDTRLVCESSPLVWEEVHQFSRDFVRDYLMAYPERPMVRLHTGQHLKTEWNGKWWSSRVTQVDASLAQVLFVGDGRREWIYRGSTRLAPLYLEFQAAERHRPRPMPRSKVQPRVNMPYVEYTRSDEQEANNQTDTQAQTQQHIQQQQQMQNEEIRRQRAVAKKSTSALPQVPAPPSTYAGPPPSQDPVTSRVVYYTPKNAVKPLKMVPHKCTPKCKRSDVLSLKELRTYNPLAKPLLSGWERQIVRFKGHKDVMYRAPCGRRIRNMPELHHYLRSIDSDLPVDLFDFHPNTHCLAEFVLNKCLVGKKDLSHGKENVPVPCVNYYDDSLPEFCSYNTERTPTAGVPLNIEPEFLCGCDCTDDCQDKSKCACWKMTLEGARTIGLDGPNVGYVYKRLPEPLPSGIYECNSRCKCKHTCLNRVAQHPLQLKLQVFKTPNRGWGIRALNDVPKGSFLCVYAGNLLTDATANLDGLNEGDEYLAELDYIEVVEQMKEGYEEDIPETDKKLDKKELAKDGESSDSENASSSEEEDNASKTDKEDDDFQPGYIGLGVAEFNKRLRKREKSKKDKEQKEADDKDKEKDTTNKDTKDTKDEKDSNAEEDCITISDDEEIREPSRFMAQTKMGANEYISKYKSVRTLFGKDEACYIMDAKVQGNIGRYLNHSCCPNVFVQNVFVDTHDPRFPWVAFFALSHIRAGTELTWNYNYDVGSVPGKVLYCYCGAVNCRGRLL